MIRKMSLADEVADNIKQQISSGQYQTGEKLPIEPELMKHFGVGRSTIREAIKILSNSGMLKVQQGIGTFIQKTTDNNEPMDQILLRANSRDLDEVRQIIEMKIAEKAALNRTEEDILVIRKYLLDRKNAALAGTLEACIEADINFHNAISVAAKNNILSDLYRSTSIHLKKWFIEIYTDTTAFAESQQLHEQLLKNIIASDPKKAWNTAAKIIGHISQ